MSTNIWFKINDKWIPGNHPIDRRTKSDRRVADRRQKTDRRQRDRRELIS